MLLIVVFALLCHTGQGSNIPQMTMQVSGQKYAGSWHWLW